MYAAPIRTAHEASGLDLKENGNKITAAYRPNWSRKMAEKRADSPDDTKDVKEEKVEDEEEEEEEVVKKPEKGKKMSLTKEERVGIILLCGSRSLRQTAEDFNKANPDREKITHSCVSKLLAKFRETGSILDKPHVAKKRVTDETTSAYILAKFSMNPSSSIRRMALETNVSKTSIRRILRANRVVTISTIGAPAHNPGSNSTSYNYGEFGAGNGYTGATPPAKKKPARPRKSKAAIAAAAAATATTSTVTNNSSNTIPTTANNTVDHQIATKWQQHQLQQQHHQHQHHQHQPSSSDAHTYNHMPDYKDMPNSDYMVPVPPVLKSPKAHKVAAPNWNAPSVGYGYGGPMLYPSGIGYIDPVTQ